jgi:formylglycine-generating enzyme required for sulfatase activity
VERIDNDALTDLIPPLARHPFEKIRQQVGRREDQAAQDVFYACKGGYELVWISEGEFVMGSPASEKGRISFEGPQHTVHIPGFYMGRYPVTNEEYARYLADNAKAWEPRFWADRKYNQPRQPVVGVSWEDAKAYAKWAGLQLPGEAIWEYACRANAQTRYYTGNTERDLKKVGWYSENSDGKLHPVGRKEPNSFGLYDMHGNVWEWVEDDWHNSYKGVPEDGNAWVDDPRGDDRVIRGGSFLGVAADCRSALRYWGTPDDRGNNLGFRLVSLPDQQSSGKQDGSVELSRMEGRAAAGPECDRHGR